jgi:hypothetical protein
MTSRARPVVVVSLWLGLVIAAVAGLWGYATTGGEAAPAPGQWPLGSSVRQHPARPTLVLFLHPHCPCSRATLAELSVLMEQTGGRLDATVFFIRPDGVSEGWERGELWRRAQAIAGVAVKADPSGAEARRFGARTSGEAILYAPGGRLAFYGGITPARGHEGENPGRSAIVSRVMRGGGESLVTRVLGCALFTPGIR